MGANVAQYMLGDINKWGDSWYIIPMTNEDLDKAVAEYRERQRQKEEKKQRKVAEKNKKAIPKHRRRLDPHKAKVQAITRKLISDGKLQRTACAICGDTPTEAHHPTYDLDHPDRVVFLCRYHHSVAHYYKQLHEKGEIASITQSCVKKYHKEYKKLHLY